MNLMNRFSFSSVILLLALLPTADVQSAANVPQLTLDPVDAKRKRTVPIRVYLPKSDSPQPVVLFSHGLGGSRDNNPYLGTHWAANGYVAVFIQHHGSDDLVWKNAGLGKGFAALKNAAGYRPTMDRFQDVRFNLDQLEIWNAYLRNSPKSKAWLQSSAPRRDCNLPAKDVWEWK